MQGEPLDRAALILERMSTGYHTLDSDDRVTYLNAEGERLIGLPREQVLGTVLWDLFPGGRDRPFGAAYAAARATGTEQLVEAWSAQLGRWLEVRVVPDGDELGVYLSDVSARRRAREVEERSLRRTRLIADTSYMAGELTAELDGGAEDAVGRLARLVVPDLAEWSVVTLVDGEGGLRDVGTAHARVAMDPLVRRYAELRVDALTADSYLLSVARTGLPELIDTGAVEALSTALKPGEARELIRRLAPESLLILPLLARGRTVGLLSLFDTEPWDADRLETATEVASRAALAIDNNRAYAAAQTAQTVAETYARRMSLLSQASELLSSTFDSGVAVGLLARLVVPELADWCAVWVASTDGQHRDVGAAHREPGREADVHTWARRQHFAPAPDAPVSECVRTGEPVVLAELPGELLDSWVEDPETRAALRALTPGSLAVMPLKARDRVLGAMALVTLPDRGPQTRAELDIAEEVARRAGLALDNARLYAAQRALAETLQRSLLTAPPEPAALAVAVRYVAAASAAQVGGDWYDAFEQPGGSLVLAIGDVIGHDSRAAAAMGQLRGLLRGIGYTTGAGPAEILRRLDEAMEGLRAATTATAVVCRLDPDGGLSWSNAGHPPPMLVSADGTVRALEPADADGADLLLGVLPRTERAERRAVLRPGDTLFLYTDGLVERRGVSLDDGLAELRAALGQLAGEPLETLCDRVLERLLPPAAEDDVALVAVRPRAALP